MTAFADYFKSVYTPSDGYECEHLMSGDNGSLNVLVCSVTEEEVLAALRKSKNSLLSGFDGVPSLLVRDCACVFAAPMHHICNLMLAECKFQIFGRYQEFVPFLKVVKLRMLGTTVLSPSCVIFRRCSRLYCAIVFTPL